jgi:hypothetical protein
MTPMEFHRSAVLGRETLQARGGYRVGATAAATIRMPCRHVTSVCLLEIGQGAIRLKAKLAVKVEKVGFVSHPAAPLSRRARRIVVRAVSRPSVAYVRAPCKYNFWRVALAALFLGASAMATAADAPLPSLGAHVFLGQGEGLGVSPAVTPAMDTQPTGGVFVIFNAGYSANDGSPVDTYGNRWKPLGHPLTYADYGDRFDVRAYVATTGKGGPGHTVSIVKHGEPRGELSLPFVEVRHASRVQAFAQNYAEKALVVASDEITVDGPATLLAFWWGDGGVKSMTATPGDGFQLPDESGVQGAVAWRQVDAAGTYRVHWTVAPVQGAALWIIAVR